MHDVRPVLVPVYRSARRRRCHRALCQRADRPPFGVLRAAVYRACFLLIAELWLWGVVVYVWTRYRINYAFLFGAETPGMRGFLQRVCRLRPALPHDASADF
jgi:hypothetical protein